MAEEAWREYRMLPRKTWDSENFGLILRSRKGFSWVATSPFRVISSFWSLYFLFLPRHLGVSDLWADNGDSPGYPQFLVSQSFRRCQIRRQQMEK